MFQVLALCQSETDAGAHWQMVMKLFFFICRSNWEGSGDVFEETRKS